MRHERRSAQSRPRPATTPPNPGKIQLGDGKERSLQHMLVTSFWHPDGTPMSSQHFIEVLYGQLPEFVKDEAELRALWSAPDTRAKQARLSIHSRFSSKQQFFLDVVLQHDVTTGVQELAQDQLTPLLRLRSHNSIADVVADLGKPEEIVRLLASFQKYLYEPLNVA